MIHMTLLFFVFLSELILCKLSKMGLAMKELFSMDFEIFHSRIV
jgi:hypothetical protein